MKYTLKCFILSVLIVCLVCSCSQDLTEEDDGEYGRTIYACISITGYGDVYLELYPDVAPLTVENFVSNANDLIYNDTLIHWVGSGFGIQGGDPTGSGYGLEGQNRIKGEFTENGVKNKISHVRTTVTMARSSSEYDSATSQFMILVTDQTQLDGRYAAFGRVISNMAAIDAISAVQVYEDNYRPVDDIVLKTVTVYETLPESVILD